MHLRPNNVFPSCIVLLAVSLVWSFLSHRPMMSEGVQWYFHVLQWHHSHVSPDLIRYIEVLIQAPAVLFLKLFGTSHLPHLNLVGVYLLSFGWTMHIMASLFFSLLILKKHDREDLLIFQIVGILGAYMQASGYAVSLALPAMSFFWPLFFFLLFEKGSAVSSFFWFLVMAVALMICYEGTVIFFGFFCLMALWDMTVTKRRNIYFNAFIFSFSVFAFSVLLKKIFEISTDVTDRYWFSFFSSIDNYRLFGFFIVIAVLIWLFLSLREKKIKSVVTKAIACVILAGIIYFVSQIYTTATSDALPPFGLYQAFFARSTALPVTLGIAVACFFFKSLTPNQDWFRSKTGQVCLLLLLVFTVLISITDVLLTNQFRHSKKNLEKLVSQTKGCLTISQSEYQDAKLSPLVEVYTLPYATIMLQILNEKVPIRTLIFTNDLSESESPEPRDFCLEVRDGIYRNNQGFDLNTTEGFIAFLLSDTSN